MQRPLQNLARVRPLLWAACRRPCHASAVVPYPLEIEIAYGLSPCPDLYHGPYLYLYLFCPSHGPDHPFQNHVEVGTAFQNV